MKLTQSRNETLTFPHLIKLLALFHKKHSNFHYGNHKCNVIVNTCTTLSLQLTFKCCTCVSMLHNFN